MDDLILRVFSNRFFFVFIATFFHCAVAAHPNETDEVRDVDERDLSRTAFEEAQQSVDLPTLKLFTDRYVNTSSEFYQGVPELEKNNALIVCIANNDDLCFEKVIAEFTAKELTEPMGLQNSPLYFAASFGYSKYVKRMLKMGANPNISYLQKGFTFDEQGSFVLTPLLFDIVRKYIALNWEGVEPHLNADKSVDYTKDLYAIKHPKRLKVPVEPKDGAKIDYSAKQLLKVIKLLLDYGADTNLHQINFRGRVGGGNKLIQTSVLYKSVFTTGVSELVELLIEHNADVNYIHRTGIAMARMAIEANDEKTLDVLVSAGAEISFKKNPAPFRPAINRWFYKNGYDANEYGLLSNAIYYQDIDFFNTLINDEQVNVDQNFTRFDHQQLPLKWAIAKTNLSMIEALLKKGVDPCLVPDSKSWNKLNAYQAILKNKQKTKIVAMLLKYKSNSSCYREEELQTKIE